LRKIINALSTSAMAMSLSALPAFADEKIDIKGGAGSQFSSLTNITVPGLISGLIRLLVIVAAVVFFFMLVIGGIKWIMSGGDKGKTEEARNQITAALVGLVVVFSAWAIAQLVKTLFGVDIFNLTVTQIGAQ
jgi:hypothetical protein